MTGFNSYAMNLGKIIEYDKIEESESGLEAIYENGAINFNVSVTGTEHKGGSDEYGNTETYYEYSYEFDINVVTNNEGDPIEFDDQKAIELLNNLY